MALCVGDGEIGFGLAVGGADDVRGLVHATLKFAYIMSVLSCMSKRHKFTFVAIWVGIGVHGINVWVVTRFTESAVCAV